MNQKNKTQKARSTKNKRTQARSVESLCKVYKNAGQQFMFHLWKKSNGKWNACWTLYPEKRRGINFVLQRGELSRAVLQLQHKSGRKSVYIWTDFRLPKGFGTLQTKTKKR